MGGESGADLCAEGTSIEQVKTSMKVDLTSSIFTEKVTYGP